MSAQQAAWDDLPLGVQQRILVLTGSPCARRVSKAWRDAFDAENDTLCFSHVSPQNLETAAAAATRVVKNSASLTAVNIVKDRYHPSLQPMLPDLLAAGATSGLATRLQKLASGILTTACATQQLQDLRQCTSLTHLDISGSNLVNCPTSELAAALRAMPRLTRLHICGCVLQSKHGAFGIASALQPLTQLQHLHLARTHLGNAGLVAMAPALSAMPGLQTLDVSKGLLAGAAGAKALCTVLGAVPGLTHLDVSYSALEVEGAALLAAVLRGMTRLQTLNMSYTKIGDDGLALLAPALEALPHLHTLNVMDSGLGANTVTILQPMLAREGSPLGELDLSWIALKARGAQALASGLSTAAQLRGLSLEHTQVGEESWVALAPSLSLLGPSLQWLQLGPGRFHGAACDALAAALQALTGLTRLEAKRCFTPAAMAAVSPALMGMRRLQVLDLTSNAMSAEGTAAFATALPTLAGSLKHLTLLDSSFDAEAAANALAPALAQASSLVELRLGSIECGALGAQWLVPVLSTLPHLRKVDLWACKLGVQGCMAVVRALRDRDGAVVNLGGNGVTFGSAKGYELRSMPGVSVRL